MCFRRTTSRLICSFLLQPHFNPSRFTPDHCLNPCYINTVFEDLSGAKFGFSSNGNPITCSSLGLPKSSSSLFSGSENQNRQNANWVEGKEQGENHDDDDGEEEEEEEVVVEDENEIRAIETIIGVFRDSKTNIAEAKRMLEQCEITPSPSLVINVLSRLRNDWPAAFTFFLWAGKQPSHSRSLREYHTMISILGKMRKFDTAWSLIDEMRGGRTFLSMVTPQTLLIMIRKYCAIHDVGKAINTFYAFKRFNLKAGIGEFQDLLSALCRYKNVEDAEHLLYCNERTFPFEPKSFNIILNGWCNMVGDLRQAKRFWREMGNRGIVRDVISYSSIISCYSKAGSLNDVLKLFNQMKQLGIVPDRKVYNAIAHALAKGKCVREAIDLVKTMEEKGLAPDSVTYTSLIKPLCKARRLEEARAMFNEMLRKGLSPSFRTYHAFFSVLKNVDEAFDLLEKMKRSGCPPTADTYIMLIRKFCRWGQHENAFKLWNEMEANGPGPDRSSYIVLIHGLFLSGKCDEAFEYYEEMKAKGFSPEPRTEEMIKTWVSAKEISRPLMLGLKGNELKNGSLEKNPRGNCNTHRRKNDFLKQPDTRSFTRERGFSFRKE